MSDIATTIITIAFTAILAIATLYGVMTVGKTPKVRTGKEAAFGVLFVAAEITLIIFLWLT